MSGAKRGIDPVKFIIDIDTPISLGPELLRGVQGSSTWKYRILAVEVQRLQSSAFRVTLDLHPADIRRDTDKNELFAFRDRVVSLISVSAMVPVSMLSKGNIIFPLGGRKYELVSLGPMTAEHTPTPLVSFQPLVEGLAVSEYLAVVIYFIWQAINATEPIYRFINLSLCVELLANAESPAPASVHPHCANQRCGFVLERCPECAREWRIPNSLGNRVSFLLPDEPFRKRVIRARNRVFHGAQYHWKPELIEELWELNLHLLLALRNYVGSKIGLSPIPAEDLDLNFAVNSPQIVARVNYTVPKSAGPGE